MCVSFYNHSCEKRGSFFASAAAPAAQDGARRPLAECQGRCSCRLWAAYIPPKTAQSNPLAGCQGALQLPALGLIFRKGNVRSCNPLSGSVRKASSSSIPGRRRPSVPGGAQRVSHGIGREWPGLPRALPESRCLPSRLPFPRNPAGLEAAAAASPASGTPAGPLSRRKG